MATDTVMASTVVAKGLEGVIVAESKIGFIDGQKGVLIYRGHNIHDLVPNCTYEEVAYLLLYGQLPNQAQLVEFKNQLAPHFVLPAVTIEFLKGLPRDAVPMAVLRTAISSVSFNDPDAEELDLDRARQKGIKLIAASAAITACFDRIRKGLSVVAPDPALKGVAEQYLYMLNGHRASDVFARALDVYFILLAEHGFNASTFTARCVISTLSDVYSAITAAIGSLKGPLHGGANEAAMDMLLEIGNVENTESYIRKALEEKRKIMGFGHRVYKTEDPRSTHLRKMASEMARENKKMAGWYAIQQKVESLMDQEKGIKSNVDFYSATVLTALGIDHDLFTPLFAVARMAGWTAHIVEQLADNRLIRPRCQYVGSVNLPVPPLAAR